MYWSSRLRRGVQVVVHGLVAADQAGLCIGQGVVAGALARAQVRQQVALCRPLRPRTEVAGASQVQYQTSDPRVLLHPQRRDLAVGPLGAARVVRPLAYRAITMSSNSVNRRVPLGTVTGANVPARSRGTAICAGPAAVCTVLAVDPFRELPLPRPSAA